MKALMDRESLLILKCIAQSMPINTHKGWNSDADLRLKGERRHLVPNLLVRNFRRDSGVKGISELYGSTLSRANFQYLYGKTKKNYAPSRECIKKSKWLNILYETDAVIN